MIIPANINHASLEPMALESPQCKINSNIGIPPSLPTSTKNRKLHYSVHYGADTVMDLSTGGDIPRIRQAIIDASPIPIGTVPIYEALSRVRRIEDLSAAVMLEVIESRPSRAWTNDHPRRRPRPVHSTYHEAHHRIVSRGGSILAEWMVKNHKQKCCTSASKISARSSRSTTSAFRWATPAARLARRRHDEAQFAELKTLAS